MFDYDGIGHSLMMPGPMAVLLHWKTGIASFLFHPCPFAGQSFFPDQWSDAANLELLPRRQGNSYGGSGFLRLSKNAHVVLEGSCY